MLRLILTKKVDGTPLKENEVLMVRLPNLYLKKIKKSNPEPYTFHIDAEFLNGAQDRWNASTVNRDRLNELLLQSAFRKISEANQGIGNKAQRHIVAMNSGGPVDDGPPTLEQYLRLGLTLANLTDDEREVVRKLYEQTFKRNEK